jgi:hypothetical protein
MVQPFSIDAIRKLILLNSMTGDQAPRHTHVASHLVSAQRSARCSWAVPHLISFFRSEIAALRKRKRCRIHTIFRLQVHRSWAPVNGVASTRCVCSRLAQSYRGGAYSATLDVIIRRALGVSFSIQHEAKATMQHKTQQLIAIASA